jgi:competence protein ComEA
MKAFRQFVIASVLALGAVTAVQAAAPLDINKASAEEIAETLQGIGLKRAQDIVAFRSQHGPFKSIEQLLDVKGVGEKVLEKNRANIRLQ